MQRLIFSLCALSVLIAGVTYVAWNDYQATHAKTNIRASTIATDINSGRVISGERSTARDVLKSAKGVTYESPEHPTNLKKANAVALEWEETGGEAETVAEVRTFDGGSWTPWTELGGTDDGKEGTPESKHAGIVLTKNAQKAQYRFIIAPGQATEIKTPKLNAIDATEGPDPTKTTLSGRLFGKKAQAVTRPGGPRIFSRTEWGSPDGEFSPRWDPEYRPLNRVIVHHTASTVVNGDSAAAVRAIWYQHANTQGWGDIGYNYLVDPNGAIFQGRAYDKDYAQANNMDVVGGHALGNNYGTTGISAIGNFSTQSAPYAMLNAIGAMAGYKAMTYSFDPGAGSNLVGHRDVYSTNCPGNNVYNAFATVRAIASNNYGLYYREYNYGYSYQGQGVNGAPGSEIFLKAYESANFYVDLKNEGAATWQSSTIHLGTSRPYNRPSGLATAGWLNADRPPAFTQKVTINNDGTKSLSPATAIAPGEIARFAFPVKAPNVNGTLNEYFHLVVEGYSWFPRDLGVYWIVNVSPEIYRYQFVDQTYEVPANPNTDGTLSLTLKNTGNVAWTNNGDDKTPRLAPSRPNDRSSALRHASWASANRVSAFTGKVSLDAAGQPQRDGAGKVVVQNATQVAPGEAANFTFDVRTPARPVVTNEYFNLVVDGKLWMPDLGVYWPLNQGQNYRSQWTGQSAAPVISKASNPIGTLYFDYKNTGSYAWDKSGIIRLGTSRPLDRASVFATFGLSPTSTPALPANTKNWLSTNRAADFTGKVSGGVLDTSATAIQPGEVGRFQIPLDTRNVAPGVYRQYFQMVADGFAWLEDYGVFLDVTVQP